MKFLFNLFAVLVAIGYTVATCFLFNKALMVATAGSTADAWAYAACGVVMVAVPCAAALTAER